MANLAFTSGYTPPVYNGVNLNFGAGPNFLFASFNQSWSVAAFVPQQARLEQRWEIRVSATDSARLNQLWALPISIADAARFNQTWALFVVETESGLLEQVYALLAFEPEPAILNQRWFLEAIPAPDIYAVGPAYLFTLTGAPDSLPDAVIPITSWQSRVRSGTPSFLSVVVPALDAIDSIEARPNGELVVTGGTLLSDGSVLDPQELARANQDSVRVDQGGRRASITLTGFKQTTYNSPKTVTLAQLISKSTNNGRRRVRAPVNFVLRPLDTADIGNGETLVVDEISYVVGVNQAYMDISETEI